MKILWLAAQGLPEMVKKLEPDEIIPPTGGWIIGASKLLTEAENVELGYCFPHRKYPVKMTVGKIQCYTVRRISDNSSYTDEDYAQFREILQEFSPDVIQIFGTEHTQQISWIEMIDREGLIDHAVVWIQGMVYWCARHYNAGLNERQLRGRTIKEWIKRNNILDMKNRMIRQGDKEFQAFQIAKHVITRTDWDRAGCTAINPELELHHCNETLRPVFYQGEHWKLSQIKRHSIFVSQSNYPIKGFHKLLEALTIVKRAYPDVAVYTTGRDYLRIQNRTDFLRMSNYQRIIRSYCKRNQLTSHIVFCGVLNAEQMKEQYLSANVFVSSSSIENSPNSLGEAMICGTPCIASDVGGVTSMLTHNEEGFVYPFDESYVLAEYICRIFRDDKLAECFSHAARKHALVTHDPVNNNDQLLKIYHQIAGEGET